MFKRSVGICTQCPLWGKTSLIVSGKNAKVSVIKFSFIHYAVFYDIMHINMFTKKNELSATCVQTVITSMYFSTEIFAGVSELC